MVLNSTFDLHKETLMRDAKNVFDCKVYDAIFHAAKLLFGDKNVTYNDSTIFIKDKVCIELSLSWNEQKVYFYTYFDLDMMKGEKRKDAGDINHDLRSINPYFRIFAFDDIIQYLQIKEIENRFIRNHEG